MRQLWAPWRLAYLANPRRGGCFLFRAARSKDRRRSWVVHRGRHAMVLLNLYPYSNGHLLVAPLKHVAAFGGLSDAATLEMLLKPESQGGEGLNEKWAALARDLEGPLQEPPYPVMSMRGV